MATWKQVEKSRKATEAKAAALPDWCRIENPYGTKPVLRSMPAAAIASGYIEFCRLIAFDYFVPEYRNCLADEWRALFTDPLKALGPAPGDLFSDESKVKRALDGRADLDLENMSMYQMFVEAYGQEYADAYQLYMSRNLFSWTREQYNIMRSGMGLSTYEEELEALKVQYEATGERGEWV